MTSTNSNDSVSQQKPNESIDYPDEENPDEEVFLVWHDGYEYQPQTVKRREVPRRNPPDYHSDEWIRNALAKCHSENIPWLSKELKLTLKGTIEWYDVMLAIVPIGSRAWHYYKEKWEPLEKNKQLAVKRACFLKGRSGYYDDS
jgi:hypothetical protein